jgi:hypothetical protein
VDDLIKRLCLRLAGPPPEQLPAMRAVMLADGAVSESSRRGFFATMGKVAVGAAAVVAGVAIFSRPSEAASALHCCEGVACPFTGCFHGMALGYTWSCAGFFCHDCFTDFGQGQYFCTFTVARARAATRHTTSHHVTSHHAASTHVAAPQSFGGGSDGFGEFGSFSPDSFGPPAGFSNWG